MLTYISDRTKTASGATRKRTGRKRRSNAGKRRARVSAARRRQPRRKRPSNLPDWGDLQADASLAGSSRESLLAHISTTRFFLFVFALAAAFTLYVGHVQATQQALARLQDAQQENMQLHLKHNRLKSTFDAQTSPAVIYRRADGLGLEQSIAYGPTIEITSP